MAYLPPMCSESTDTAAFHAMVEAALNGLPDAVAASSKNVVISVIDLPPHDVLKALHMDDPMTLTGLYDGIPLTEKSLFDQPLGPDIIWLYRLPILHEWQARGSVALDDLVAHVLVHELAHHFGWSDADIALIDRWWE